MTMQDTVVDGRAGGVKDTTGAERGQGVVILIGGEATGGRFALVETVEVRGAAAPRHRHQWEDETLYVLDGELAVCLGTEWHRLPAGAALLLPRGVEHAVAAVTPAARVLSLLTPAGFEGFHRELAEPCVGAAVFERLVATAARYGCEITGPPPTPPGAGDTHAWHEHAAPAGR